MIDELDLLHDFFHPDPDPDPDYDHVAATDRFREALAAAYGGDRPAGHRPGPTDGHRRRHRRAMVAVGAMAAAVVLAVGVVPAVTRDRPEAAAAELRAIAGNAAGQVLPTLGAGQFLETSDRISLLGTVTEVGGTPTPHAEATVDGTFAQFDDAAGDACVAATTAPARFAGPLQRSAWRAAGMLESPTDQPITTCSTSTVDPFVTAPIEEGGLLDVSRLPTDPVVLARELATGTTPVHEVNELEPHPGENPGFVRAAYLLASPKIGTGPNFATALYEAMSLLPGVRSVGTQTSHLGVTGTGFTGGPTHGGTLVVLDPSNGALLEVRNLESPLSFLGIGASYLAPPPVRNIGTAGGTGGTSILWLDPVGRPTVVDSLPDGMVIPASPHVGAALEVGLAPGVGWARFSPVESDLARRYGPPLSSGGSFVPVPGSGGSDEFDFSTVAQMEEYAAALRASPLVIAVHRWVAPAAGDHGGSSGVSG